MGKEIRLKPDVALMPIIMCLAVLLVSVPMAKAASTSNLTTLTIDEDYFYNYDFLSEDASSNNVDWPVNMLFYNNAEVDKIKDDIYWGTLGWPHGSMHARINDGDGWEWDKDKGTSHSVDYGHWDRVHLRLYAPYLEDRFYNIDWGYYVLGTSHLDDDPSGPYGLSEDAEHILVYHADAKGYAVYEDWDYWYNEEPYREEGDHYWYNDGYTSAVNVP